MDLSFPFFGRLLAVLFAHESIVYECSGEVADATVRLAGATAETGGDGSWSQAALSGFISENYVYLVKQKAQSANGFRMRFVGRFTPVDDAEVSEPGEPRARLVGRFMLPWTALTTIGVGFLVCVGWLMHALFALVAGAEGGAPWQDVGYAVATLAGAIAVVATVGLIGARDKRWIKQRIERALAEPAATIDQG